MQTYQVHHEKIGWHLVFLFFSNVRISRFQHFIFLFFLLNISYNVGREAAGCLETVTWRRLPAVSGRSRGSTSHAVVHSLGIPLPSRIWRYPPSPECSRGFGKSRRSGLRLLPGSSQRDSESKLWLSESGCLISWKLKVSLSNSKEKCLKQYLDIVITQCVTRRRQRRPAG